MTVQEFLSQAKYLYHLTREENISGILSKGLLTSCDRSSTSHRKGIYVSRTDNSIILSDIFYTQLGGRDNEKWVLISIDIRENGISANDIAPDLRTDDACKLACKIMRDVPIIDPDNIKPFIPLQKYKITEYGEIINLTGYNCRYKERCDPLIDDAINGGIEWSESSSQ